MLLSAFVQASDCRPEHPRQRGHPGGGRDRRGPLAQLDPRVPDLVSIL
jgi:hypothetical protein